MYKQCIATYRDKTERCYYRVRQLFGKTRGCNCPYFLDYKLVLQMVTRSNIFDRYNAVLFFLILNNNHEKSEGGN